MANSSEVTAGVDAVAASNYNNLRKDILDISTGHEHSGIADGGKQLDGSVAIQSNTTPLAAMASRTKKILLPWNGIQWSDYSADKGAGMSWRWGMSMYSGRGVSTVWAHWMVPEDFVSGLSLTWIALMSGTSGHVYRFYMRAYGRRLEGVDAEYDVEWAYNNYTDTTDQHTLTEIHTISLPSAAAEDIIHVEAKRDSAHASDTGYTFVSSPGLIVEYTGR